MVMVVTTFLSCHIFVSELPRSIQEWTKVEIYTLKNMLIIHGLGAIGWYNPKEPDRHVSYLARGKLGIQLAPEATGNPS